MSLKRRLQVYGIFALACGAILFSSPMPVAALEKQAIPPAYAEAVQELQHNRYGENDIKSFVYHIFSMYDYHVPVEQFYPYLIDEGLEMQFPEGKLQSHRDFQHWYDVSVGENIRSNTHTIENLQVHIAGDHTYHVDFTVWWQAETRQGDYVSYHVHQKWTLVEIDNALKIKTYTVEGIN